MTNISQSIWVESLKARRSKMPVLTALAYSLLPLVGGFFMIILRDPELARQVGLISAKAQLTMGAADWPTYFEFLAMGNAVAGLVISGMIASWMFGREYSDRTLKDLLALPTSRTAIVCAKFLVVLTWSVLLALISILLGFAIGAALALPPISNQDFLQGAFTLVLTSVLTIILVTPVAFFASAGRGYLPPMGFIILTVLLAQIFAIIGYGEYFPWAIPGLLSQGDPIRPVSYGILLMTSILGVFATILWWELADQSH